jgi:hypothetical protein
MRRTRMTKERRQERDKERESQTVFAIAFEDDLASGFI